MGEATGRLMSCRETHRQNWASKGNKQSRLTRLLWQRGTQINTAALANESRQTEKFHVQEAVSETHNHLNTHTHTHCGNVSVPLTTGGLAESRCRHAYNYIINAIFSRPRESFREIWGSLLLPAIHMLFCALHLLAKPCESFMV